MNRKLSLPLVLLTAALAIFTSCSSPGAAKQNTTDSIAKDHLAPSSPPDTTHRDTTIAGQPQGKDTTDSSEPTLQEIYDQYIASYTAHCIIDSSFRFAVNKYKLHVEHVCTFDSAIIVPKLYASIYKMDSFVTHNFVTHITLQKNGKKILDRTLTKKDFWLANRPELSKYAVLFCPRFKTYLGTITLDYSISIPLTDIGVPATATIDDKGAMHFQIQE